MGNAPVHAGRGRKFRLVLRWVPAIIIGALFAGYAIVVSSPAFFSPDQQYQVKARELDKVTFTTYFDWYQSSGNLTGYNPHVIENWTNFQARIDYLNSHYYPSNWPGPRDVASTLRNVAGNLYRDGMTFHPPATQPTYTASGDLIAEPGHGVMENITTWLDPFNQPWHEWELRCMIRAGIDVAMPDYWNNGLPSGNWSQQTLAALVLARQALVTKVSLEADVRDPSTIHEPTVYGEGLVPKIAMFFDTTCMRSLWAWNLSMATYGNASHAGEIYDAGPGPDLKDPYWQWEFWSCIDRFYSIVNSTNCFTWNGSSVVWLYGGDFFADVGTTVLQYCRPLFLAKYGRPLLFAGHSDWVPAGPDAICDWGACFSPKFPALKGIPTAAVSPGFYNLGALSSEDPRYVPRDVQRYQAEWHRAIDLGAVWVHVETWNELHEGTGACWTQEDGFEWVDATGAASAAFHAQREYNQLSVLDTAEFYIFTCGLAALVAVGAVASRQPRVPNLGEKGGK